jgi:threonine dehydratase
VVSLAPSGSSGAGSAPDSKQGASLQRRGAGGAESTRERYPLGMDQRSTEPPASGAPALPSPEIALPRIQAAAATIAPHVVRTPTVPAPGLSEALGIDVVLKLETLQRTGAFKVRGALNKLFALSEAERARGVIASSAGNHAQGVALASKLLGCPATIVMPEATPTIKVDRTQGHGEHVEIVLHGAHYEEAYDRALELAQERGSTMVHPFDDLDVIYGQGTIGLELVEQTEPLDAFLVPIGGGGLIAGIALALKALWPSTRVIGVQAEGAAPMVASYRAGEARSVTHPRTIADGIQVGRVGQTTWPLVRDLVDECVTVDEESIVKAMVFGMEQLKLVTEGAGATGLAALLSGAVDPGNRCGVLLCGGNVDLKLVARVIESGLTNSGRYHRMVLRAPDVPGTLQRITAVLTRHKVNIVDIDHHRMGWKVPIGYVDVEVVLEVRDASQGRKIDAELEAEGFRVSTRS